MWAPSSTHLMQVGARFPQPLLHVDLLRLVAREGDVDARQRAVCEVLLPFELIEEVVGEVALAEEQPALALGTVFDALLDEGAVGRNAGAGADHDDRAVAVLGQAEMAVRLDVDARRIADLAAVGEVGRGDAVALLAV